MVEEVDGLGQSANQEAYMSKMEVTWDAVTKSDLRSRECPLNQSGCYCYCVSLL